MKRRDFSRYSLLLGLGAMTGKGCSTGKDDNTGKIKEGFYMEPSRQLPVRDFDVVVAGGGTAGVVAALAAARQGARTVLVEGKGYTGGTVVEGGTALHSFYNLWTGFPGVEKQQVVRGIAQEIIDRLVPLGGSSGHSLMYKGLNYDSVCTAIDTELYKLVTLTMLSDAGIYVCLNTFVRGAVMDGRAVRGVVAESRSGRELFTARSFVDCTAYGDLSSYAGASFTEPNDYEVCNSIGMGNVDIEKLHKFLESLDAVTQLSRGTRGGKDGQVIRVEGRAIGVSEEFGKGADEIGMSFVTTTLHDNYLMFIKFNIKLPMSPTDRDTVAKAELELRQRQFRGVGLFRKHIPGCEKAFIARTSPGLNIRRGRLISCDYDITHEDVIEARHFDDEVFIYGFHDSAPRYQVKDGGTYGIPYRALCVKDIDNLYVSGMMITTDQRAHMSTRNTVSCMGQGQATGTAAALCARKECGSRDLPFDLLRDTLLKDGVYFGKA